MTESKSIVASGKLFVVDTSTHARERVSILAMSYLQYDIVSKYQYLSKFLIGKNKMTLYGSPLLMADRSKLVNSITASVANLRLGVDLEIPYPRALVSVWFYLNRVTDIAIPMANYNPRDVSLWTQGLTIDERLDMWNWIQFFQCDVTDEKIIEWFNLLVDDVATDERYAFKARPKIFDNICASMREISKRHQDGMNPNNKERDAEKSWNQPIIKENIIGKD